MTGRTALLGGALGLAFAALLLSPCALSGGVPARGDLADFFWPMKAYTAARWPSGVPLWNPLSGCGEPWPGFRASSDKISSHRRCFGLIPARMDQIPGVEHHGTSLEDILALRRFIS